MSVTVATSIQGIWADSFATSVKVGLTLRANGEEPVQIITGQRTMIPAGIAAPTVAPTVTSLGTGSWGGTPAGVYGYYYQYASSQFPNVEAITTAGGMTWPKSLPSPPIASVFTNSGSNFLSVSVTKTTAPYVDQILIFRTSEASAAIGAAQVQADLAAGNLYFCGSVPNNGSAGTVLFTDTGAAPQEQMELDNYPAPIFWHTVYESPYWWGFGNPDFIGPVSLTGTSTAITLTSGTWFSGRNGQAITFDGILAGGYDGNGTYYFNQLTTTTCQACTDSALTQPAVIGYIGTTTARIRGFAATLYRSKPNNPFAWGYTQDNISTDGDGNQIVEEVPQEFAMEMGGGHGVAIIVLPSERLLKLDCENPPRCYTLNLALADQDNFGDTKRTLDGNYVVTSQKSQFNAGLPDGETAVRGMDAYNYAIVQAGSGDQGPVSSPIFKTLRTMVQDGNNPRLVHGAYDPTTELSTWWFKTMADPSDLIGIDTAAVYHGPSNQWSLMRSYDVTASDLVYDATTQSAFVMLGTGTGQLLRAYKAGNYIDAALMPTGGTSVQGTVTVPDSATFAATFTATTAAGCNGRYFDVFSSSTAGADRFYFWATTLTNTPPSIPAGGRLLQVQVSQASPSASQMASAVVGVMGRDARYQNEVSNGSSPGSLTWSLTDTGLISSPSQGTAASIVTAISQTSAAGRGFIIDGNANFNLADPGIIGSWVLLCGGPTGGIGFGEQYGRITAVTNTNSSFLPQITCSPWVTVNDGEGVNQVTPAGVSALPVRPAQLGDRYFIGIRDCGLRTYFTAGQSDVIKTIQEFWITQENVDPNGLLNGGKSLVRQYVDFQGAYGGRSFTIFYMTQQTDDADMWLANTGIGSYQTGQFGIKIIERGYLAWRIFNFAPKVLPL